MHIKKEFLPINQFSRPGIKLKRITGIVLHYPKWKKANKEKIADIFRTLVTQIPDDNQIDRYAGCHDIIDDEGVLQLIPHTEMAYHCGSFQYQPGIQEKVGMYPNSHTIGIEICHPESEGRFYERTIVNLVEYVATLLLENDLSRERVYRHWDIVGVKPDGVICPEYYVNNIVAWTNLLDRINTKKGLMIRKY